MTLAQKETGALPGVLLMAGAVLVFVGMDSCVKWLSGGYMVSQVIFVRACVALTVALGIGAVGGWSLLKPRRPGFHALRAMLAVMSTSTFFYAFSHLPLADAYAVFYMAPLAATALASVALKEPVPTRAALAIGIGLVGVGIVVLPRLQGGTSLAYAACIAGMLSYSASSVVTRRMSGGETLPALLLYPALLMLFITAPMMPWHWVPPSPGDLALLMSLGLMWPAGMWLVVLALRRAPVARVAPVDYSSIVWVVAIDFAVFDLAPALATLVGSGVIIFACLVLLRGR